MNKLWGHGANQLGGREVEQDFGDALFGIVLVLDRFTHLQDIRPTAQLDRRESSAEILNQCSIDVSSAQVHRLDARILRGELGLEEERVEGLFQSDDPQEIDTPHSANTRSMRRAMSVNRAAS